MKRNSSRNVAGIAVLLCAGTVFSGAYASGKGGWLAKPHESVTLSSGTVLDLRSATRLTSWDTHVGMPLTAEAVRAVVDARGDTVIPMGARFEGTVTAIAPAEQPGRDGVLDVELGNVRLGEGLYRIETRVISLGTYSLGRGKVNHPREVVLPAGGMIRLALTQPFAPELSSAK